MNKKSKIILITGAGSGIGKDSALTLARRGHTVIATTHFVDQSKELLRVANEEGLTLTTFVLDITEPSDRDKILDYDVDVLINNAAIGESGSLAEVPIERVKNVFETNLFSTLELTQLALKKMIAKDSGRVIFISSVAGRIPTNFLGPYGMTKFALSCAAAVLRNELHEISDSIHISVIEPGAYATGFNQRMLSKKYEWMDKKSYFFNIIEKIKNREERFFELTEQKTTDSIVAKVVQACEARKPKLRYSAPGWQAFGVQVMRVFGV